MNNRTTGCSRLRGNEVAVNGSTLSRIKHPRFQVYRFENKKRQKKFTVLVRRGKIEVAPASLVEWVGKYIDTFIINHAFPFGYKFTKATHQC